jgi:hypothetical protein
MKYSWAVAANVLFVLILLLVFANAYDDDTRKILAGLVLVFLAVNNKGNAIARQVANLTTGLVGALLVLHKKAHPGDQDQDVSAAQAELNNVMAKLAITDRKLLIHEVFGIVIGCAMVLILLG